jgi:hypothetical protein
MELHCHCRDDIGYRCPMHSSPTAKPEPTEDHRRRARDLLNASDGIQPLNGYGDSSASLRTVARLLAERDAMQAELAERAITIGALRDKIDALQPTPDPDLVLAREAAAQILEAKNYPYDAPRARNGERDEMLGVQSALRALKLAKEQG